MHDTATRDRTSLLAHYIITVSNLPDLGKTKLYKTMWFADVFHYRRYGVTVSGQDAYVRMDRGPVPRNIDSILSGLVASGAVLETTVPLGCVQRHRFTAIKTAPASDFSSEEIESIFKAITMIAPLSAHEASVSTHDELWRSLEPNQAMPICAAAIIPGEVTPEDMNIVWQNKELLYEHREAA